MTAASSQFEKDRLQLFADTIRRLPVEDVRGWQLKLQGDDAAEQLAIVDAELAKRRPGFSLPLIQNLSDAAADGDLDAQLLLYGKQTIAESGDDARPDAVAAKTSYPGGKGMSGTYHKIIRLMPPHDVYVEPFLGKSAVMRNKMPARNNFGVEIDKMVVAWWQYELRRRPIGNLQIIQGDALKKLRDMSWMLDKDALVYADPEYLRRVCTSRPRYQHAFNTERQHRRLLDILMELAGGGCRVMISGYYDTFYAATLRGWKMHSFVARTRGRDRQECLWCSFDRPTQIHDVRYAGEGFRETGRIKKKVTSWGGKFAKLGPLEQQAILVKLKEIAGKTASADDVESGDVAGETAKEQSNERI